MCSDGC